MLAPNGLHFSNSMLAYICVTWTGEFTQYSNKCPPTPTLLVKSAWSKTVFLLFTLLLPPFPHFSLASSSSPPPSPSLPSTYPLLSSSRTFFYPCFVPPLSLPSEQTIWDSFQVIYYWSGKRNGKILPHMNGLGDTTGSNGTVFIIFSKWEILILHVFIQCALRLSLGFLLICLKFIYLGAHF